MHRCVVAILCFMGVFAFEVDGQKASLEPLTVAAGTVLIFHLQTRLNPGGRNEMDALPKGTELRVKMLNGIDSGVNRDGAGFRGEIVSPVVSRNEIVLHSESEVRGLLALLRSRKHPEGFRYELLITTVNDHGKSYDITASLSPSFTESRPGRSN